MSNPNFFIPFRVISSHVEGVSLGTKVVLLNIWKDLDHYLDRYTDRKGVLSIPSGIDYKKDIEFLIMKRIAPQGRGYTKTYQPLSEYATALQFWTLKMMMEVILIHFQKMEARVPEDLLKWFLNPKTGIGYPDLPPIRDPYTRWTHPYEYLDPKNKDVSQRVYWAGVSVSRRTSDLVEGMIQSNLPRFKMSTYLHYYLIPGERLQWKTNRYGDDASHHLIHLSRSEVLRAGMMTSLAASYANPVVEGMDWALHPRHPKVDICDPLATLNGKGDRLKDPYPLDEAPVPILDSHPMCLCSNQPYQRDNMNYLWDRFRRKKATGSLAPLTPMVPGEFFRYLAGDHLYTKIQGERS